MFELIVSREKISNGIEDRCLDEEGVSEYPPSRALTSATGDSHATLRR